MSVEERILVQYGTIDYPKLLLAQLNRIAEIRSRMGRVITRHRLEEYRSALVTLWMLSPRSVRREVGNPPSTLTLEALDEFLVKLRDALEKRGLIGRGPLEVGTYDADIHEEGEGGI